MDVHSLATPAWAWLLLVALGAFHGLNPGMGWLFAVSLGLQEQSRRAVVRAIGPLVLGHVFSVGLVVAVVALVQARIPHLALRIAAALILVGFGAYRLARSRHSHWVGMRVGFRDLTLWSFLMSSAHGAGLMLLPILIGLTGRAGLPAATATAGMSDMGPMHHMSQMSMLPPAALAGPAVWAVPVGVHTLGYLLLTALIALLVYEKLGVRILRRAWFNLDFVWSVALVGTGILTLAM